MFVPPLQVLSQLDLLLSLGPLKDLGKLQRGWGKSGPLVLGLDLLMKGPLDLLP